MRLTYVNVTWKYSFVIHNFNWCLTVSQCFHVLHSWLRDFFISVTIRIMEFLGIAALLSNYVAYTNIDHMTIVITITVVLVIVRWVFITYCYIQTWALGNDMASTKSMISYQFLNIDYRCISNIFTEVTKHVIYVCFQHQFTFNVRSLS